MCVFFCYLCFMLIFVMLSVVVDLLFIVAPIVGVLCLFHVLLCTALCKFLFCSHLDGFYTLSFCSLVAVIVQWLFFTVLCIGLQCMFVVFPDHNHLLFSVVITFKSPTL